MLWMPVALAFGIGAYFSLHVEPWPGTGVAAVSATAAACFAFRARRGVFALFLAGFLFALGFSAAQMQTLRLAAPALERKTWPLNIEGRVRSAEVLPEDGRRIILDFSSVRPEYGDRLPQAPMPTAARLRLKKGDDLPGVGDVIRLRAMLTPLPPPTLPGAYDFQRRAYFLGVGATGFALAPATILKPASRGDFFDGLRRALHARIHAAIGEPDLAAITTALLYGEDGDLSPAVYDTLRRAGLAHIVAISGLQVTIVTGFFFFLVRALLAAVPYAALRWPVKKITALLALAAAVFYMRLIGVSLSAERSVIMVVIAMLAIVFDRDPFTLRLAAAAAFVLLLLQPDSLLSASFQLSFAAVIALISFYESTRDFWSGHSDRGLLARLGVYILGSLATTFVATCATAPIALYHFLTAPLLPSLLANLIAVPLSSFIALPAAIFGALLMPLGWESAPLRLAAVALRMMVDVAEPLSQWPYALARVEFWPLPVLILIVLSGLWVCIWRGALRWIGAAPFVLGLALAAAAPRPDVLVAASGKLSAVRGEDGVLWLSPGRAEKFVRQSWADRSAKNGVRDWDEDGSPVACDDEGCIAHAKGRTIAFPRRATALTRDCAEADMVISMLNIPPGACAAARVIDAEDLGRNGAHAIFFSGRGRTTVQSVGAGRGQRPWSKPGEGEDD